METPSQTVGPFLEIAMPWADGATADAHGVRIAGQVFDGAGDPVPDALIETWHPDPPGFARCATDDEGRWQVTVPYVPFVAVHVFARGLLRHLTTRIYLDPAQDDGVLDGVPEQRRATLIATLQPDGTYHHDLRIQGDRETVFFDV